MEKPKICVLTTNGTNCQDETAYAFNRVGGEAEIVFLKSLVEPDPVDGIQRKLQDYQIIVIPGGFSHGDYLKAGKVFAENLKRMLGDQIDQFLEAGKLMIGICNGFQVLVKYGLLPNLDGDMKQTTTNPKPRLIYYWNSSKFFYRPKPSFSFITKNKFWHYYFRTFPHISPTTTTKIYCNHLFSISIVDCVYYIT